MCPYTNQIRVTGAQGNMLAPDGTMCLQFGDTDQEKEIGVGVSWPHEKLGPNECIIFSGGLPAQVGDKLTIRLIFNGYWNNMRIQYNKAALENSWNQFPQLNETHDEAGATVGPITVFSCTVKTIIDQTYGKMPDENAVNQILMEFEYYTDLFAYGTTFDSTLIDEQTQ